MPYSSISIDRGLTIHHQSPVLMPIQKLVLQLLPLLHLHVMEPNDLLHRVVAWLPRGGDLKVLAERLGHVVVEVVACLLGLEQHLARHALLLHHQSGGVMWASA